MGDRNQLAYLGRYLQSTPQRVLEVGSRDYGSTAPFRAHFDGSEYLGLDLEDGANVDCVHDLESGLGALAREHFDLVICCSVLEHVRRPWRMAENIAALVRPGGALYVSVPWVWRYHPYPDDYFRFSWRGVQSLFADFRFRDICYSTTVDGEFLPITEQAWEVDNRMALKRRRLGGKRKYLPYLMVNMLGIRH